MALDIEKIIADLKESTVVELNDLVSAIEEEFGVEAAAPVAAAVRTGLVSISTTSQQRRSGKRDDNDGELGGGV